MRMAFIFQTQRGIYEPAADSVITNIHSPFFNRPENADRTKAKSEQVRFKELTILPDDTEA